MTRLAPSVVRRKVAAALRACGSPLSRAEAGRIEPAGASFVTKSPGWVAAMGALAAPPVHWIWCEPRPDCDPKAAALGQIVVNVPPGRYLVETLDAASRHWSARESATGGPLVCGLPFTGGPILLRVHHVGPAQFPDGRDT